MRSCLPHEFTKKMVLKGINLLWFKIKGFLAILGADQLPDTQNQLPQFSSGGIDNASPASRRATDMQWKVIGSEKHVFHWHSDFYSVSKRRVPNGPDPIHNRRVENSKQPPVRA
ncbi:uncharacterized protein LOC111461653 isoform X2 [Cucurbita moschata]|uniref:Uncharacterized protein LOC111461653 isoform X2 n=1 Tax=Cucurbita moschata TaxID=3662 RepID=A0A6J1HAQ4_CUCMO|nr:uncharacterized protein LOC111461653 isoform X2 [Cucurbita moschata]